jgi:hypothetical protein
MIEEEGLVLTPNLIQVNFFFLGWDWGLNSGLCISKAGVLPLNHTSSPFLLWLFWRLGWL